MNKKLQDYSLTEYYLVLSIHGVNKMKSQLFIFMNIFMNKPIVKALGKRRPSPVLQTFSPPGGADLRRTCTRSAQQQGVMLRG